MGLENIQLQSIVLQDLFKNTLVDLNSKQVNEKISHLAEPAYLGENKKNIVLITNSTTSPYLPDNLLNFLIGILGACRLTMADVALINFAANPDINYSKIEDTLKAEKIILFGVDPGQIELPLKFPLYQIQKYNAQIYLSVQTLEQIESNKEDKLKLWNCLKQIFNIS